MIKIRIWNGIQQVITNLSISFLDEFESEYFSAPNAKTLRFDTITYFLIWLLTIYKLSPQPPKLQHYWNLTIRLFSVISGHSLPFCWFDLVSVFNGISTVESYLMPKSSMLLKGIKRTFLLVAVVGSEGDFIFNDNI